MNKSKPKNKYPASVAALTGSDLKYPYRYACVCIVAYATAEHNPSLLREVLADPALLLSIPQGSTSSYDRLDQIAKAGALDVLTASEMRLTCRRLEGIKRPDPSVDALFDVARFVAAHAVADEVRQGKPGLWSRFVAVAEALRPYAPNAGEDGYGRYH